MEVEIIFFLIIEIIEGNIVFNNRIIVGDSMMYRSIFIEIMIRVFEIIVNNMMK